MSRGTFWVGQPELTEEQISKIRSILGNVEDKIVNQVTRIIWDCKNLKDHHPESSLTPSELITQYQQAKARFERALQSLDYIDAQSNNDSQIVDQHFIINHPRQDEPDLPHIQYMMTHGYLSVKNVTDKIILSIQNRIDEIISANSETLGTEKTHKFAFLINSLADCLEENTEMAVSDSKDTRFYQLISFVLSNILSVKISSPDRYIQNALQMRRGK